MLERIVSNEAPKCAFFITTEDFGSGGSLVKIREIDEEQGFERVHLIAAEAWIRSEQYRVAWLDPETLHVARAFVALLEGLGQIGKFETYTFEALLEFADGTHGARVIQTHAIHFEARHMSDAIESVIRFVARRQQEVPDHFGPLLRAKLAGYTIKPVADDGILNTRRHLHFFDWRAEYGKPIEDELKSFKRNIRRRCWRKEPSNA